MMKVCTKCGEEKPREAFDKNRSKKDGLQPWCRACVAAYHQTDAHREVQRKSNARRSLKWPAKQQARSAVSDAVKLGRIDPASAFTCVCGQSAKQFHHFAGYEPENWFAVDAYCRPCHLKEDRREGYR